MNIFSSFYTKLFNVYLPSLLCTLGALFLIDFSFETSFLIYFILWGGFVFFFSQKPFDLVQSTAGRKEGRKEGEISALFLSTFLLLGNNGLDLLIPIRMSSLLFFAVWFGLYLTFLILISAFYMMLDRAPLHDNSCCARRSASLHTFWLISFILLWAVYFLFFLNQYPGSLCTDSRSQIMQAMGDRKFENANPLINTLIITACVKLGLLIDGSVNTGIALYTFFQFTITAAIFAHTVTVIYKNGFHWGVVIFAQCFFNFMPYNIAYAIGMWKDTFFAVMFLAVITQTFDLLFSVHKTLPITFEKRLSLFLFCLVASLARNSGWSSLLFFGLSLLIWGAAKHYYRIRSTAIVILSSVFVSFFITFVIYPILGVTSNGNITVGLSVPLQQVARVVAENGDISPSELTLISEALPIEEIQEAYDEVISDPIKKRVNKDALINNPDDYLMLWISLGFKNPRTYLDAYLNLTKKYWFVDTVGWTWDTRIFENPYGITRSALIFPAHNLTDSLLKLYHFPKGSAFRSSALILWLSIILFEYASVRKRYLGRIMYLPILTIFAGLLITSPTALFRYTYGAAVCIPLLFCFPYCLDS